MIEFDVALHEFEKSIAMQFGVMNSITKIEFKPEVFAPLQSYLYSRLKYCAQQNLNSEKVILLGIEICQAKPNPQKEDVK